MMLTSASWKHFFAGQNDVQPSLHVPMVYEQVSVNPPQWDYHVVSLDPHEQASLDEAALNELGKQGWLLVSVLEERLSEGKTRIQYYFVKQKEV